MKKNELLLDILEVMFDDIGPCTTIYDVNLYKGGSLWKTLNDFLTDKMVMFPVGLMANFYYDEITNMDEYENIQNNRKALKEFVTQLWADDDIYIDAESIRNSFSYNEEL